jgi:hypothetical protein
MVIWRNVITTISLAAMFIFAGSPSGCKKKGQPPENVTAGEISPTTGDTKNYAEIKPAFALVEPAMGIAATGEGEWGEEGIDLGYMVDLKQPLDGAALRELGFVGDPESPEAQGLRRVVVKAPLVAFKVCSTTDDKYEYIVSEIPLQIQVPEGRIKDFLLEVKLKADDRTCDKAVVRDGFPKDLIEEKYIVEGKVTCGVNLDTNTFIPPPLPKAEIGVEIKPIEFRVGAARNVKIDFSGPGNTYTSWYLNKDGIQNDLTVFLITRREKSVETVTADVEAKWKYDGPGWFDSVPIASDSSTIRIYPD